MSVHRFATMRIYILPAEDYFLFISINLTILNSVMIDFIITFPVGVRKFSGVLERPTTECKTERQTPVGILVQKNDLRQIGYTKIYD